MIPGRGFRARLVLTALAATACAGGADTPLPVEVPANDAPPVDVVLDGGDILVSDADIDLSIPAAIDVDGAGNVWIVDRRLAQVRIVDPGGAVLHTFGRVGGGPGEFRGPRGLGIRGDRAYVLDNVHGVQSFDMQGNYVEEYPASRIFFDFDITGDGSLVASNNRVWARGGLISVLGSAGGEEIALFGELLYPDIAAFDLRTASEQLRNGVIPDALRNGTLPVAAPDGSLWLAFHTETTVRRYAPDGTLLAESTFELPEMPAILEQYHADFAAAPAGDVFFFPSLIAAGTAVGDRLWLLWETVEGQPGLITVHGPEGDVVWRLMLPVLDMGGGGTTVMDLAVDESRRRLYVSVSDIATVFAVELPETVVF